MSRKCRFIERSEAEWDTTTKERASLPSTFSRPIAIAKPLSVSQLEFRNNNCIILNAQKGKIKFVRTSVRVLCLLIVRYTSPVPQIFSESINTKGVWGLFGVWMAQRIKHTTEGVKTLTAFKTLLIINKTNVNIIIMLFYSCLFGA